MNGKLLFVLFISVWLVDAKIKDNDVTGSIMKRLDSLEWSNRALTHANTQLKTEVQVLKKRNDQLEQTNDALKVDIQDLRKRDEQREEGFGLLKSQIDTLTKKNDNLMPAMNYHGVMSAAAYTCPQDGATCLDGLYANVYDCQTYWSCTNCVETLMNCDPLLEFSDADKMCVAPAESGCTEIPSSTTIGTTTTSDGVNTTVAPTTNMPPITTTAVPPATTTTGGSCLPSPPVLCDSSDIVAFFVRAANQTFNNITVLFEDVQLNLGGAYDVATGEFTAPVTGLYLLSYNGLPGDSCGSTSNCLHMYNYDDVLSSSCSELYASGGTSITVLLTAGDVIWLESEGNCDALYNIPSYITFSGHLLFQIQ